MVRTIQRKAVAMDTLRNVAVELHRAQRILSGAARTMLQRNPLRLREVVSRGNSNEDGVAIKAEQMVYEDGTGKIGNSDEAAGMVVRMAASSSRI